jgi:hypothetical protein
MFIVDVPLADVFSGCSFGRYVYLMFFLTEYVLRLSLHQNQILQAGVEGLVEV